MLVVGLGGIGCPAALALAHAGVGTLGLLDDDEVDETNLHRQILFSEADRGKPKVDAGARALRQACARIEVHATRLLPSTWEIVRAYDIVVEGADNLPTKFLAADVARLSARPVVHGAAVAWRGTVLAVGADGGPCYRCLFEDIPDERAPSCDDAGVMGPVVGVVGALVADRAIRLLRGEGRGSLTTFDGRVGALRERQLPARPGCPLCGPTPAITAIDAERYGGPGCASI